VATADSSRTWGQFEHVKTGTNGDFDSTNKFDTIQDIQGALKDQYLANAAWVMRREVRTKARKLKDSQLRYLWEPGLQVGQPERLNGYPVRVDQYMPALATGSLSLAFGDFKEAYQIVDRMGIRTLRDPFTAKPYVVFYSTKRTGGGALNFEAIKFANFSA
jgi:HK97 family phage major capsid protein